MERKLTAEEVKTLETLYKDDGLIFKGLIRRFILANTYEPKYKVGDYVLITDRSTQIYGNRAINIKCKITELHYWLQDKGKECITYSAIALDESGNDYFLCAEESINGEPQQRYISGRCTDNINHFEKKSQHRQSTDL